MQQQTQRGWGGNKPDTYEEQQAKQCDQTLGKKQESDMGWGEEEKHEPNLEGPWGHSVEIRFTSETDGRYYGVLYSSCRVPERETGTMGTETGRNTDLLERWGSLLWWFPFPQWNLKWGNRLSGGTGDGRWRFEVGGKVWNSCLRGQKY